MASGTLTSTTDSHGFWVTVAWSESAQDAASNTSTITCSMTLRHANSNMFVGYTLDGYVTIAGTQYNITYKQYGMSGTTCALVFGSGQAGSVAKSTTRQNADGTGTVPIAARLWTVTPASYTPVGTSQAPPNFSTSVTVDDLSRPPLAPTGAPAISRAGTGETITVTSQPATARNPATTATTNYEVRGGTTNPPTGGWVSMGSSGVFNQTSTTPGSVYYFQTRVTNSEGTGPESSSGVAYAAPSITSTTTSGITASVTVAAASSNGGSTVTSHKVEASISSTFATVDYTNTISGASGGTTNFTLAPGKTWYFRSYAVNSVPVNSPYSASTSIFVAAYGKHGRVEDIFEISSANIGGTLRPNVVVLDHGFSVGDKISISGVSPGYSAYNSMTGNQGVITEVSTNNIILGNMTYNSANWSSGGSVAGYMLTTLGKRRTSSSTWVDISTAKKYTGGAWVTFQ